MMPNMIKPQYNTLPTERGPTAATMTAAVTATLKAGADPATPITVDSNVPNEPAARLSLFSAIFVPKILFFSDFIICNGANTSFMAGLS
jgi:hypothetical protein